jgi:DNA-3-methyladenine glycosylase I
MIKVDMCCRGLKGKPEGLYKTRGCRSMPTKTLGRLVRCPWLDMTKADYIAYHDSEWGVPVYDDRLLFEFLALESAQAGLSWYTVLRKRDHYRRAFAGFEPEKVALFNGDKIEALLGNPDIIRNRKKIEATVNNARRFLEVQAEYGRFSTYLWGFVGPSSIRFTRLRTTGHRVQSRMPWAETLRNGVSHSSAPQPAMP